MKTIKLNIIIILFLTLCFGSQDSIAPSDISLELLSKEYKDTTIKIEAKIIFLAKLTNKTKDTLNFYEEWNSWGFWNCLRY
jgi:hypothetical protein